MNAAVRSLFSVFRVGVGAGLLWYVMSATGGWRAVGDLMDAPWLMGTLVGLAILGVGIEAVRLQILCQSQDLNLSFLRCFRLVAVGGFFNFAIPGGTGGDVVKLFYLAADHRGRGVEVAMILLVDRVVGMFSLLAVVVVAGLLSLQTLLSHSLIGWMTLAAVGGMLTVGVVVAAFWSPTVRGSRPFRYLTERLPLARHWRRAADALYAFRQHGSALWWAVLISVAGHGLLALTFLAARPIVLPEAPVAATALLAFFGLLANALPITPGGLGVGEAAFEGLFKLVGVAGGARLMLIWRLSLIPVAILGAGLYMAGARLRAGSTHGPAGAVIPGGRP